MLGVFIGLVAASWAAEDGTWVGGAGDVRVGVADGALSAESQVEVDYRVARGPIYARLDVDVLVNTSPDGLVRSWTPPEWAMVQVEPAASYRIRGGILNPQLGYEDWDFWVNPLPTYSTMFVWGTPGRILGGEAEVSLGESTRLFAWGGSDLDWRGGWNSLDFSQGAWSAPAFGVGITSEQDFFSTWSGAFALPQDRFYAAVYSFELYPAEALSIILDGSAGVSAGAPYAGGQVILDIFPEATFTPVVRAEALLDRNDAALGGWAAGVPDGTASVGLRVAPLDFLTVLAEAKATFTGEGTVPGAFLGVEVFRPEPSAYSVVVDD
jgi:hypothetical protein